MTASRRVTLGRVTGVFGVKGWVKVWSYTDPPGGILDYPRWRIGERVWEVGEGRIHGEAVVARLEGLDDRDAAMALQGASIEVERSELPKAKRGEFYWADVLGGDVVSTSGALLGTLDSLTSNGAQDVMVVAGERERLIPVVPEIVRSVDVKARRIVVEWEPEY